MDTSLRDLERRFIETGLTEDETAWLREHVRAHDVVPERIELAARLGHAAAQLLVGERDPVHTLAGTRVGVERLTDWLHGALQPLGTEAYARAMLTIVRAAEHSGRGVDDLALRLAAACEEWLRTPSPEHKATVDRLLQEPATLKSEVAAEVCAMILRQTCEREELLFLMGTLRRVAWKDFRPMFDALRNQFGPWLLGYSERARAVVMAHSQPRDSLPPN